MDPNQERTAQVENSRSFKLQNIEALEGKRPYSRKGQEYDPSYLRKLGSQAEQCIMMSSPRTLLVTPGFGQPVQWDSENLGTVTIV